MQQIAEWLGKLNLGQYSQRFAENDIDVSVLPYLTDADLEKIGVSLGHRRKILAAIAELPGAAPAAKSRGSCRTETPNAKSEFRWR
jgi:SAM domain (Sterile alpha motif)